MFVVVVVVVVAVVAVVAEAVFGPLDFTSGIVILLTPVLLENVSS